MRWLTRGVPAAILLLAFAGAAEARDYYGAIAYSRTTRAQGYVYDQDSQDEAESAALVSCSDLAADCEPVTWFRNACGALAVSSDGAYGTSWGEDEATAEKKALKACGEYAKDCQIVRRVCTTR
jgi:uncharacterized protein DUF4189